MRVKLTFNIIHFCGLFICGFYFKDDFRTCTLIWLMKNRDFYHKYIENITYSYKNETDKMIVEYFLSSNFSKMKIDCNFENRLTKCNKNQFNSSENLIENHIYLLDGEISFLMANLIQIVYLLPITCTLSILFSFL